MSDLANSARQAASHFVLSERSINLLRECAATLESSDAEIARLRQEAVVKDSLITRYRAAVLALPEYKGCTKHLTVGRTYIEVCAANAALAAARKLAGLER